MPTLLRALITQRHWQKFATFEAQFRRSAAELSEIAGEPALKKLTVSPRQFERWYSGKVKTEPYPDACRVLEHMFGHPVHQLLAPPPHPAERAPRARAASPGQPGAAVPADHPGGPMLLATTGDGPVALPDGPVWFGVELARMIALMDTWQGSPAELGSLQDLLHQEILMFDAAAPDSDGPATAAHSLSRRQALVSLAALPAALAALGAVPARASGAGAAADQFLARCAGSLTACWHLLRGSDLPAVEQVVPTYLLALEAIARQESAYQRAAARLASQAHRICGIVALHREKLAVRELHCKQALYYANLAADGSSQASALISLASTCFYNCDPQRAARIYERALAVEAGVTPLQRSRAYAEVAVVYGELRREQEALRAAGLAEQLYPDVPEDDSSFLYAEFTPGSLILEQGLAYAALAEQFPQRRYQDRAAGIFSQANSGPRAAVPDRIHFEIINHQARTAVLLGDLDAFETYLGRALDGVVLLGSKQRHKEMRAAWQRALARWPRERRLTAVGERLQLTSGTSGEGPG